ncbi:hypothetical protein [uncultured Megasphaera sp.]|uniref:hypothetical protein n=1 Tax=uncultured Megasphaera sp. TaxID=165188 RepID=UPI00258651E5|nr:hypothetical protein [uncultured Megasphaera sp.]
MEHTTYSVKVSRTSISRDCVRGFFIAKQLGFQILALTAHQEGSFIRKYFPVVYSCRFAEMANKKGKVLVPDKEIKTAFFEEHHPESLARLDEYEQLGLF